MDENHKITTLRNMVVHLKIELEESQAIVRGEGLLTPEQRQKTKKDVENFLLLVNL